MAGRVTARRLNRVEYNNTIRDLLGVAARPADEFPVDDSGYGFDNNGDVLSVSPMLMEKYMQAAEKISRLAVYGEAVPPKPTRLVRLMNRRSQDAYDVLSEGNSGVYLPYSLRGAMYGDFTFPVDGEYEFRLRIANFRGDDDADITDEERARRAEERRKLFEARKLEREKAAAAAGTAAPAPGGGRGGGPRREPTPEELKARDEAARKAAPPRKLILTVDGAQVISTVIEGTGAFGYSQGEFTARATVKAGERFIRASYPELADLDSPLQNINPDMRRGLFVDYLDIVGPFNPSAAPPESHKKIFICSQKTTQCARTILSSLMERAYRRPVTDEELKSKLDLVALAQREGDSFDEGIRLALQAILASPNFLFRIEANPSAACRCPSRARPGLRSSHHVGRVLFCGPAKRRQRRAPRVERVSGQRHRARVAALVLSLGEHARRRADAGRQGRHAAAARRARGAGAPHDGRPEGVQPGRELGGAVASAAEPGPHQARSQAVSDRGRRAHRCHAHRDDDVRRDHHQGR